MPTYSFQPTALPVELDAWGAGVSIVGSGAIWADGSDATYVTGGSEHHPFASESLVSMVKADLPSIPDAILNRNPTLGMIFRAKADFEVGTSRQLAFYVTDNDTYTPVNHTSYTGGSFSGGTPFEFHPSVDDTITTYDYTTLGFSLGDAASDALRAGTAAVFFAAPSVRERDFPLTGFDSPIGYLYEITLILSYTNPPQTPPRQQYPPARSARAYPPMPNAGSTRSGSAAVL